MATNEPTQGDPPNSPQDWLDKPPPPFKDEARAPTVDRELLWSLIRDELSDAEQRGAYRLIYSFRSWSEAHKEILVQHYHETRAAADTNDTDPTGRKMS